MPPRKKPSTTIGAKNYSYLHNMVKTGRAESVGNAGDKAVELARRLDNRATLEHQTAAYFNGLSSKAAAEEADLEDALSAVSQERTGCGAHRQTNSRNASRRTPLCASSLDDGL